MRPAQAYEEEEVTSNEAEFSLGMGTLIGIFFGLALVCGLFFGFGYMMGHRAPGPYVSSEPLSESPKPTALTIAPKPSAQIPEQPSQAARVVLPNTAPDEASSPSVADSHRLLETATPEAANEPVTPPKPQIVQRIASTPTPAPAIVASATVPSTLGSSGGTIMVQIAAVKNRPDAEALAEALRKNGFSPTIRTEPQDKLLHVQIGPFPNRDDAKAMRQKLSSAGYDAFIK